MRTASVIRLRTFAKITLLFFAVLFTAVLVHPDLDLLDVHDVKITNPHSQLRPVERQLVQQAPIEFAGLPVKHSPLWETLLFVDEAGSSRDLDASSILRI